MDEKFMDENEIVDETAAQTDENVDDVGANRVRPQDESADSATDGDTGEHGSPLQEQLAESNDKLLRLMAEFDNFKKRSAKEKEDLFSFVVCDVVAGFLPILDNLDRAVIAAVDGGEMLDGVKLIQKQFADTLIALGVEEIKSVGEEFNPELHNAVMHVEDSEVGANVVVEEFMKGYAYKGRVIRHSMVKSAN